MGDQVYKNFKSFCKKKKPSQEVFEDLTPTILNNHLKSIMDGLSAKVFRTYNASKTLQDELLETEKNASFHQLTPAEKVVEYNNANRQVAILCNHQRSVSKAQETQLENLSTKLDTLKKQKKTLKQMLKILNNGGSDKKIPTKKSDADKKEEVLKAVARAKEMKNAAKTNEEKIAATKEDEKAKQLKKEAAEAKFTEAHLWEKVPTKEQVSKRITQWTAKITKMELDLKHKDDNKEVSLGTSKVSVFVEISYFRFCKIVNDIFLTKTIVVSLIRSITWILESQLHGVNEMKYQSRRYFLKPYEINLTGLWLSDRIGLSTRK